MLLEGVQNRPEMHVMLLHTKESGTGMSHGLVPVSYTHSDAADDMQCVDLGGRRIIKKKNYTVLSYAPVHS